MTDKIRDEFWGKQMADVMKQIGREAAIAHVKILDPGVIEAVLRNDEVAAGSRNPLAFKKLRESLMMGFMVREKAFERLGPAEASELFTSIREAIVKHFGDKLGGPHE